MLIEVEVGNQVSASQLRKAKEEVLKLCIAYIYAVKHRLRGEFGVDYDDYEGVLPKYIARFDAGGFSSTSSPASGTGSYQSVASLGPAMTRRKSDPNVTDVPMDQNKGRHEHDSHDHTHGIHFRNHSVTVSEQGPNTPLLGNNHRTVEFHPYADITTLPLPLM